MARTLSVIFSVALVLLFALQGCAMDRQKPETKVLTGTIRIVGNEPFPQVVLTVGPNPDMATRDQDYLIVGPLKEVLRRGYQWKKLTLEGEGCSSPSPAFKNCFNPFKIVKTTGVEIEK